MQESLGNQESFGKQTKAAPFTKIFVAQSAGAVEYTDCFSAEG